MSQHNGRSRTVLSNEAVRETRLESLWNGVETVVDIEGLLFKREHDVRHDYVAVYADGEQKGTYNLTIGATKGGFLKWCAKRVSHFAGSENR